MALFTFADLQRAVPFLNRIREELEHPLIDANSAVTNDEPDTSSDFEEESLFDQAGSTASSCTDVLVTATNPAPNHNGAQLYTTRDLGNLIRYVLLVLNLYHLQSPYLPLPSVTH